MKAKVLHVVSYTLQVNLNFHGLKVVYYAF